MLHRSRLDLPNNLWHNGERALQGWLLAALPAPNPLTVFDVGAHIGTWSRSLLELAGRAGRRTDLHVFEPAPDTYRRLTAELPDGVHANRLAVSDHSGETTLHVLGPRAGRNSLHLDGEPRRGEPVRAVTLDEYAGRAGIEHIHLLKIDAEGHDFQVLSGAARWFGWRAISLAQFEYNHRWVHSRHYLKDVFDLLAPFGYQIGKVTPRGIEWYPAWDPDLETFVEGNYVAATRQLAGRLPGQRWWKEGSGSCTSA